MKEMFHVENLITKGKTEEKIVFQRPFDLENIKDFNKSLVEAWREDSIAAEQYRILRTHILKVTKNSADRIFLVSSAVHSEGKTLTAINLAISIVKGLQEKVLLIDADLRKPNVSYMLGLERGKQGLAEYLTHGGDFTNYITNTPIPKLNLIPSGLPPYNPSELIDSDHMVNLIKQLKHQFNNHIVIIDSPPLIPVTDSIILSFLVDGVIIVVKVKETQREVVNEAIEKIGNNRKILGLVLNGCEFSRSRYHYYYHYLKDKKKQNSLQQKKG